MKYNIFGSFLLLFFLVVTFTPFMTLEATELWNRPTGSNKSSDTSIYNTQRRSNGERPTLYNSRIPRKQYNSGLDGGPPAVYQISRSNRITEAQQIKYMSKSSALNRMIDTDIALQREFDRRKRNAQFMNELNKQTGNNEKDRALRARYKQKVVYSMLSKFGYGQMANGNSSYTGANVSRSYNGYTAGGTVMRRSNDRSMDLQQGTKLYNSIR